jgi:hypothetical protein
MAEEVFFPFKVCGIRDNQLARLSKRYALFLTAMGEEPLCPPSAVPTWRLLVLPTFGNPHSVRLEAMRGRGKRWQIVGKQNDGWGGWFPGPKTTVSKRLLSPGERYQVSKVLERLRFWSLPISHGRSGLDGTRWVLEGVDAQQYQVVHRWSPSERGGFLRACKLLLCMADFSKK